MNIDDIKKMAESGESDKVEFKETTNSRSLAEAGKTLCAFLNSGRDGTVLFGVSDKGKIIGQQATDKTKKDFAAIVQGIHPFAGIDIDYIEVSEGKVVIALYINTVAINKPYYFRKIPYYRSGPTTQIMEPTLQESLISAKQWSPKSWENLPAEGCAIEDLDFDEISGLVRDGIKESTILDDVDSNDIPGILDNLELVENGQIINAAMILFGKRPFGKYTQCVLHLARFRGKDKSEFIDSQQIHGNAFKLLKAAEEFCRKHFPIASRIVGSQMHRESTPFLPREAIREAIINAIVHRDYTYFSGAIYLAMYDDRVEIENEGKLPKDLTPQKLKERHRSYPRNPKLCNVFARRGLIENWGRGTQDIVNLCLEDGHPEPEYIEDTGGLIVVLPSKYPMQTIVEEKPLSVQKLTERQQIIVDLVNAHPEGIQSPQLVELLGEKIEVSNRTIRRELHLLKEYGVVTDKGERKGLAWFPTVNKLK